MEFTFYTAAAGGILLQHKHALESNYLQFQSLYMHHTLSHKQKAHCIGTVVLQHEIK